MAKITLSLTYDANKELASGVPMRDSVLSVIELLKTAGFGVEIQGEES